MSNSADSSSNTARSGADAVAALVASAFGVKPAALRNSKRGQASAAFARQVAMYLAHTRLGISYTDVGRCYGRDRTTAAHACRAVEERREDPATDAILDLLEQSIDIVALPNEARAG